MAIRIANEKDKRAIYSIMSYCFNNGNSCIEDNVANAQTNYDEILVNEENGKVDNLICIKPFSMLFQQKYYKMGGIAGVSSLPEDRGNGCIASLLKSSMSYMKERKMVFSCLAPFAMNFYRKYGYEWGFSWQLIECPIEDLKGFKASGKYQALQKEDNATIEAFRDVYCQNMNGPVLHTKEILEERWGSFYHSFTHCYASYDAQDQINAIAFFKIEGRMLHVTEFYYINEEGRQSMLHFIYRHRSQVDRVEIIIPTDDNIRNILPNCRIKYWEWPNMMVRVVMVKEALKAMKLTENLTSSITLKVIDGQADWNNQTFEISSLNQKIEVKELGEHPFDFEITIQRLSQLVIGFIDVDEAIKCQFITVSNENKVLELKKIFKRCTTMMWQGF